MTIRVPECKQTSVRCCADCREWTPGLKKKTKKRRSSSPNSAERQILSQTTTETYSLGAAINTEVRNQSVNGFRCFDSVVVQAWSIYQPVESLILLPIRSIRMSMHLTYARFIKYVKTKQYNDSKGKLESFPYHLVDSWSSIWCRTWFKVLFADLSRSCYFLWCIYKFTFWLLPKHDCGSNPDFLIPHLSIISLINTNVIRYFHFHIIITHNDYHRVWETWRLIAHELAGSIRYCLRNWSVPTDLRIKTDALNQQN